jgi:hypothetical protein
VEFRSQHRKRGWHDDPKNPLDPGAQKGSSRRRAVQSLLADDAAAPSVTSVALAPRWMSAVEQVHDNIGAIKTKMAELKQKHADHIQVRFGVNNDDEQQIEVKLDL